jgi:hypothetical protein
MWVTGGFRRQRLAELAIIDDVDPCGDVLSRDVGDGRSEPQTGLAAQAEVERAHASEAAAILIRPSSHRAFLRVMPGYS